MATTNYGWNTPTVGGDEDAWGDELNAQAQAIDSQLKSIEDAVGWKKLNSGTVSGAATLDIPLPASWREFRLEVIELEPVSAAVTLQALLAFDSVPTYLTADYRYSGSGTINGVASQLSSIADTSLTLHGGTFPSAAGLGPGLSMRIVASVGGGHYACVDWNLGFVDGAAFRDAEFRGRGRCASTGARPTNVRLKFSSGNISTARWAIFGVTGL